MFARSLARSLARSRNRLVRSLDERLSLRSTDVFLVVGLGCVACGDAPEQGNVAASSAALAGASLPEIPRWPDAIGGVEQIRGSNETIVASKKFAADPESLAVADALALAAGRGERTGDRIVPVQGTTFEGGVLRTYSYVRRVTPVLEVETSQKEAPSGTEYTPAAPSVLSSALQKALAASSATDLLPVVVALRTEPSSSLAPSLPIRQLAGEAVPEPNDLGLRVQARRDEVSVLHAPLRKRLQTHGIDDSKLVSFWLNGRLAGELSPAGIAVLAADADVASVNLDLSSPGSISNTWDGTNASNGGADGLNAALYWSGGYYGDGNGLRLGFAGDGFYFNHSIFKDWAGEPSRYLSNWNCSTGTCLLITQPLGGTHETEVSSAAAGDATQGQIAAAVSPGDRLDRTGVAPEADLFSGEATNLTQITAALQKMIENGVDVFNVARGDGATPTTCDYNIWELDWSATVKNAHDAGVLVVSSAGNAAGTGCSLTPWAEATSAFVVGGTVNPADNGYSTAQRNTNWSSGPMNAYVYGSGNWVFRTNALSGVAAVVPGWWRFGATTPDNFAQTGGTSIAAPQIAGAAMLIKDAFLSAGQTYINSPGVLFAAMLAMTDRSQGASYRSTGFDPGFGGGRFQLRYFGGTSDHPAGGAWGFDLWEVTIHNNEIIDFPVRGTGVEPSTIQQFKAYAVVFEQDWRTVADVDLYVMDQNCAGTTLGYDVGFDTKSMVRVGTEAAGKALCVRVKGYAVPPAGRRVVLASYFSVDTAMR